MQLLTISNTQFIDPDSPSSQDADSPIFCPTCLKNQHLYNASLAQYHIETDPAHPKYKEMERKYFEYRKNLEKRYPQVCEDCEPRVLERMKRAGRTAKTDYLRRLMDKSRARRSANRGNAITFSASLESISKFMWYMGLLGNCSGISRPWLHLPHITTRQCSTILSQRFVFQTSLPHCRKLPPPFQHQAI